LGAGWQEAPKAIYNFDVRLDTPNGEIIGKGSLAVQSPGTQGGGIVMPLATKSTGKHKLFVTGTVEAGGTPSMLAIVNATFN
jgi:hypothetical protein